MKYEKYRIVRDGFSGFEVQFQTTKSSGFLGRKTNKGWKQVWTNTHSTIEKAREYAIQQCCPEVERGDICELIQRTAPTKKANK